MRYVVMMIVMVSGLMAADTRHATAVKLAKAKQWDAALILYEILRKEKPGSAEIAYQHALVLEKLEKREDAVKVYLQVMQMRGSGKYIDRALNRAVDLKPCLQHVLVAITSLQDASMKAKGADKEFLEATMTGILAHFTGVVPVVKPKEEVVVVKKKRSPESIRKVKMAPPKDAVEINGHHYKRFMTAKSWEDAKKACEDIGGHLVTLSDAAEWKAVVTIAGGHRLWVGCSDAKSEGEWKWLDKSDYFPWLPGQPNGGRSSNNGCLYSGQLVDDGFANRAYICEWDK